MKAFELARPVTLDQALQELEKDSAKRDRTKLFAGGQDLVTELKEHLVEPDKLVDLKRIPGLDRIEVQPDGSLVIGCLVTLATLAEHAETKNFFTALAEAARSVGSAQIRSQGTVGGNLNQRPRCWYYRHELAPCLKKGGSECYAYAGLNKYNAILGGGPSYIVHPSDLAPALVAFDAEVTLRGAKGERKLALEEFYTLPAEADVTRETVLAPDEILTHVRVPAKPGWSSTYVKFKERGSYDFALASVAVAVRAAGSPRTIQDARLVLGGVAPKPWNVPKAAEALLGIDGVKTWTAAGNRAVAGAEPLAHNAYKVPLVKGLILQAMEALAKR
ncbi:MAG: xanthine dehydrogenase family protein subunit M [Planctomycetes bacterium]|nr:xanthine dehydrogenase family protein subunit M [Planctomycetota bacterium]